jgi:hypothetical protein
MLLTEPLRYYLNLQLLPSSLAALQAEASMHAAAATADARPDRLKLVGSAAFQERLAQLKSKGLLLLKPSDPFVFVPTDAHEPQPQPPPPPPPPPQQQQQQQREKQQQPELQLSRRSDACLSAAEVNI